MVRAAIRQFNEQNNNQIGDRPTEINGEKIATVEQETKLQNVRDRLMAYGTLKSETFLQALDAVGANSDRYYDKEFYMTANQFQQMLIKLEEIETRDYDHCSQK